MSKARRRAVRLQVCGIDHDPLRFPALRRQRHEDAVEYAKDYFVMRGNVSWQIDKTVSVWIRGENITNASYQSVLGYPALSAAGYGGVKISF